jgi:polyhydroxybutyrate depolymerase
MLLAAGCATPRDGAGRVSDKPAIATPVDKTPAASVRGSGLASEGLMFNGRSRPFLRFVPPGAPPRDGWPVVLALHGGGGQPEEMMKLSGFNELAERERVLMVYPSGTGSTPRRLFWNILLSDTYAAREEIDDLGYLTAVLDAVEAGWPVDRRRVFATGFSQGGMLCYRIACDPVLSARVAAIAPVAATMTVAPPDCAASRPVPVISFHGQSDPFSAYGGGIAAKAPRNDQVARASVEESIRFWVDRAGLPAAPAAEGSAGRAVMRQFGATAEGVEVVAWSIIEGGHTWPGSPENMPEWMMGRTEHDLDATRLIWDFFRRHPLR